MSRYFLRLWSKKNYEWLRSQLHGEVLNHTSLSNKRKSGIKRGDYVYVIFYKNGRDLFLIGKMKVDRVGDQEMASEYLGENDLWKCDEHAVATNKDASIADFDRIIPSEAVESLVLRRGNEWKPVIYGEKDGKRVLEPMQFRQVREIDYGSARLLDELIDDNSTRAKESQNELANLPEKVLREIQQRRGQCEFRSELIRAYDGCCAITGCDAEPALEAAHISGYAATGSQEAKNGFAPSGGHSYPI